MITTDVPYLQSRSGHSEGISTGSPHSKAYVHTFLEAAIGSNPQNADPYSAYFNPINQVLPIKRTIISHVFKRKDRGF